MSKVCIDAGHGGSDSGSVNGTRYEKTDNLRLALELQKQFKEQNIDVVMTRSTDIFVELNSRPKISDNNNCDLMISCHENGSTSSTANGVEIWLHNNVLSTSKIVKWAESMINDFNKLGFAIRGSNDSKFPKGVCRGHTSNINVNYTVNTCKAPSMLIELGFITSVLDNMLVDKYYKECAVAIVKSSCEYLGVTYNTVAPTIKKYYKINKTFNNGLWNTEQKGAYEYNENGLKEAIQSYKDMNLGNDYFIFDPNGEIVYPTNDIIDVSIYKEKIRILENQNKILEQNISELNIINTNLMKKNEELEDNQESLINDFSLLKTERNNLTNIINEVRKIVN